MPMRPIDRPLTRHGVFETVATFAIIVALLYLGAGILVPLVLAILLAFALSPLVDLFVRRLRLPEPVAVILSVLSALLSTGAFCLLGRYPVAADRRRIASLPDHDRQQAERLAGTAWGRRFPRQDYRRGGLADRTDLATRGRGRSGWTLE